MNVNLPSPHAPRLEIAEAKSIGHALGRGAGEPLGVVRLLSVTD
jgi:hypothetical protein